MAKTSVKGLGSVGLVIDADPADLPVNAITDALNVRFAGGEIEQCLGNVKEDFYTQNASGVNDRMMVKVLRTGPDHLSNGAEVIWMLGHHYASDMPGQENAYAVYRQDMSTPDFRTVTRFDAVPFDPLAPFWDVYKGQINGCPFFGTQQYNPVGKAFDSNGFSLLPGWGEQTGGDQLVVVRHWTCRNLIPFGNRLLMLNTVEENSSGVMVSYPARVRYSGFTQSGAFPINWDDTAANRPPEEYAAATIDGLAGWLELATSTPLVDACDNGGTLFVYSERETFSLTPSGNANSPFHVKKVYSDLGALDLGCVVNAKGYNYVFTGNDFVRHDSVSWKSLAEGVCRDWLNDVVANPIPGAVRLVNYPELNEIWIMTKGQDQLAEDCAKTQCLTYNYISGCWGKKTLPYVLDVEFVPVAPSVETAGDVWDSAVGDWDSDTQEWGGGSGKIAQGTLIGSCAAGYMYYLNRGYQEARHVYSGGVWSMQSQDLHCFIERRGLDLADGMRQIVTKTELRGRGTEALSISIASSESPDAPYYWDKQDLQSLVDERRQTWLQEGSNHAYKMEFYGKGTIPGAMTIYHEDSGE